MMDGNKDRLIALQSEYIDLLEKEGSDVYGVAYADWEGATKEDVQRGRELRIGILELEGAL